MSIYVDIRKKLGDFQLDVKFDVEEETLALLGDSGCGKSITLRCIAGILKPDEGTIRINGETVFDGSRGINLKPQRRRVGYLFQNYALFPNMTVLENIMTGTEREHKMTRDQRRKTAKEFIERLQLSGLENRYPSELSGGQQQRTALARILASKPDLLMLDEPFSALDATLRWEMEQVVRATISDFSGTTLLVTHNRDEVYRLSDKVAVYNRGRIDTFGDKWALFTDPKTAVSARLTGCKNLSPAHREGDRIVADHWHISLPLLQEGNWPWLGIRAHRFQLCAADAPNSFPYEVVNRIEDTFSIILQIKLRDDPTAEPMRWEVEKVQNLTIPDTGYVSVPDSEILLLQG